MSKYETEYNNWVASLTPKQREKLAKKGLDKPLVDHKVDTTDPTVAFATLPDKEFDYDSIDDDTTPLQEALIEQKAREYGAQLLSWVFARLQSHKSTKSANIDKDALIFALGMADLEGRTQTDIARSYGIKKATFSARVKSWQKLIGIRPSSFMKSESACKAYRKARLRNLTRK